MGLIQIKRNPSARELRIFGCVWFPLFWGLVGGLLFFRSSVPEAAYVVWGLGLSLSVVGLFVLPLMRLVFVGLSYAVFPIGWTVSHVFLLIMYYMVMTPIGLLLRLFGHDSMKRRQGANRASLWEPVDSDPDLERYFRQS